jgi:hypothetical protein
MKSALALLCPLLAASGTQPVARVVIRTVKDADSCFGVQGLVANLYWSSVWNKLPDFFDFGIGHGDATGCPIIRIMLGSQ